MQIKTPVVAYLRISKDRIGAGVGVENQREAVLQLAARLGVEVVMWFVDNDVSAYDRRKVRPEYRRMFAEIEAGRVGTVLVWHTDRLHRQNTELEEWITGPALGHDVKVHSVQSGALDLNTADGRMNARFLATIAARESEHKSERAKLQKDGMVRKGQPLAGGRPFGYLDGGLVCDPTEKALIIEGTKMILQGQSLIKVADMWNAAGARRRRSGKPWLPNYVRAVLVRERNAGLMRHRGQVAGKGAWEPILSEEEWMAVRTILLDPRRNRQTNSGTRPVWLGSGLFLCGVEGCDHPLKGGVSGVDKRPAYMCRQQMPSLKKIPGAHVTRRIAPVDDLVGRAIIKALSDEDIVADLQPHDTPNLDLVALREELATIETQQKQLVGMLRKGWTVEMVTEANAEYAARSAEIESALASVISISPAAQLATAPDVEKAWAEADLDAKRLVVRELMVVRIMPAPKGQRRFLPDYIDIEWVNGPHAA